MNVASGTVFGTHGMGRCHADDGHRDMRSGGTLLLPATGTVTGFHVPGGRVPMPTSKGR